MNSKSFLFLTASMKLTYLGKKQFVEHVNCLLPDWRGKRNRDKKKWNFYMCLCKCICLSHMHFKGNNFCFLFYWKQWSREQWHNDDPPFKHYTSFITFYAFILIMGQTSWTLKQYLSSLATLFTKTVFY